MLPIPTGDDSCFLSIPTHKKNQARCWPYSDVIDHRSSAERIYKPRAGQVKYGTPQEIPHSPSQPNQQCVSSPWPLSSSPLSPPLPSLPQSVLSIAHTRATYSPSPSAGTATRFDQKGGIVGRKVQSPRLLVDWPVCCLSLSPW